MKHKIHPVLLVMLLTITLAFVFSIAHGQNVVRHGNMFISTDTTVIRGGATKTQYLYVQGENVDTVYLSKNDKAFVWRTSKKTGKRYRKYLPEVTKSLKNEKIIDK